MTKLFHHYVHITYFNCTNKNKWYDLFCFLFLFLQLKEKQEQNELKDGLKSDKNCRHSKDFSNGARVCILEIKVSGVAK